MVVITPWRWWAVPISISIKGRGVAVFIMSWRSTIFIVAQWRTIVIVPRWWTSTIVSSVITTATSPSAAATSVSSMAAAISSETITSIRGSAHVHTRGGRVRPLRDAEVNSNLPAVQLEAIHCLPRIRGRLDVLKVHESEAPASPRVPVQDHLSLLQNSESSEFFLELPFSCVETKSKHSETLVGLRLLSISLVPSPVRHGRARLSPPLRPLPGSTSVPPRIGPAPTPASAPAPPPSSSWGTCPASRLRKTSP